MKKDILSLTLLTVLVLLCANVALGDENNEPAGASAEESNTCADCHAKLARKWKRPVLEWRNSVHARAGNNCNICHGGNPASPNKLIAKSRKYNFIGKPDKNIITDFCGRGGCHATALEQFKRGPHYISVLKTSQPNCTSCHGVHNIQRSSLEVITDKSCTGCHQAEYSRDIISMIGDIDKSINATNKNIQFLLTKYADVKDLQDRLNNARHLFHQFVHVFSREDMRSTKKILELELRNLDVETKSKVALIRRLDILYIAMIIFGLIIISGISIYTIIMYSKRRQ